MNFTTMFSSHSHTFTHSQTANIENQIFFHPTNTQNTIAHPIKIRGQNFTIAFKL